MKGTILKKGFDLLINFIIAFILGTIMLKFGYSLDTSLGVSSILLGTLIIITKIDYLNENLKINNSLMKELK